MKGKNASVWTGAVLAAAAAALVSCSQDGEPGKAGLKGDSNTAMGAKEGSKDSGERAAATFGAGCFWCIEAIFQRVEGVESVVPGYSGGSVENPTYEQVCSGNTGHAEAVQIRYDPARVRYEELLEIFWKTHDPTTLNRQGPDFGTQYRSVVFYHDENQKKLAEKYKARLDESGAFDDPIVTEIVPFKKFYVAEDYHKNFYNRNPDQAYCRAIIGPKLEKFKKAFEEKLKEGASNRE